MDVRSGFFTTIISIELIIIGSSFYSPSLNLIGVNSEAETKFLLTPDKDIIFSSGRSGLFTLYKYKNGKTEASDPARSNVLNPFLYSGKVTGLHDNKGNENFISSDQSLNNFLDSKAIKTIFSSSNGFLLIYQLNGDSRVYLADIKKGTKEILFDNIYTLHHISFSEAHNFMVANCDNKLFYINLNKRVETIELISNSEGDSMTPFIYDRDVYFSNNNGSEYFQIYRIRLNDKTFRTDLVYQSDHDLRIPKFDGGDLFFIENINNEYLLKKINLNTKKLYTITDRGVVYNYEFYDKDNMIISYSDFSTPKCLVRYNEDDNTFDNLTGKPVKTDLTLKFINNAGRSPAYSISPPADNQKGVILFFHPGSDFSPRWDTILMNLSNNGYIIVAPNYPGSYGFGKSYANADSTAALADIKKWKDHILLTHKSLPLYYFTYSSGNILMEKAIAKDNRGINASISLFGIPGGDLPDLSIPSLYMLGVNDSRINYEDRIGSLKMIEDVNDNLSLISYKDEGHMFRKGENQRDAIYKLVRYLRFN